MNAVQPSLFDDTPAATPRYAGPLLMTREQRQQRDWTAWLQDSAGQWWCPACGDPEPSPETLHVRHGWQPDLSKSGHPYPYSWPGAYEEGGVIGNGGRCRKLRAEWIDQHYPSRKDTV